MAPAHRRNRFLHALPVVLCANLTACAPSLNLPADARATAQMRELMSRGGMQEAMQRMIADQMQRQQQTLHEEQKENERRRAEEAHYVYRPPPAMFYQSVVISTFDPLSFDEQAIADDDDEVSGANAASSPRSQRIDRRQREQREILRALGDPQRELAAFRLILAEREAELGPAHPDVAAAIGNVGMALAEAGDTAAAREMLDRSLALTESALGATHPDVAIALDRLAAFHLRQGAPSAAQPLYERALAIRSTPAGQPPRYLPATLNNLAVAAARLGEPARARSLYDRAIGGYEAAIAQAERRVEDLWHSFGLRQDLVVAQANAGLLAWQQGEIEQAIAAFRRARETHNAMRWLGFDRMSEAQQLAMMSALTDEIETLTALEHGYAPGRADAARLSLAGILEHKGRALESLARTMAAATQPAAATPALKLPRPFGGNLELPIPGANADPESRQRLRAELESVRAQLANLTLSSASAPDAALRRAEIERLALRERELIGAIGDRVQNEQNAAQLNAVLRHAMDEATRGSPDAKTRPGPSDAAMAAMALEMLPGYADSRLAIGIVGNVQRAIPPDAALVEIATYRPYQPNVGDETRRWGQRRYAAYVLQGSGDPQSVDLGDADAIDKLVTALRTALADPRSTTVASAGRRLDARVMEPIRRLLGDARHILIAPEGALYRVPFAALQDEQGRYLVERYTFTYLGAGRDLLRMNARARPRQPPLIVADPDFGTRIAADASARLAVAPVRSIDFAAVEFESLPGTAREAKALKSLHPDSILITGAEATETAVKRVQGPRILHVATHGFFLPDQTRAPRENPLLRSGLVFAGANRGSGGADDGILTALELAGLDLAGTQLVTLSACETGLGDVQRGEGVYGLRRALTIAGAESQVISLWKVDDDTTEALMIDFYRRLSDAAGRSEALREAQLKLLGERRSAHPFFWAGFILSGDWRPLSPRP